jgi:hypothetical protein
VNVGTDSQWWGLRGVRLGGAETAAAAVGHLTSNVASLVCCLCCRNRPELDAFGILRVVKPGDVAGAQRRADDIDRRVRAELAARKTKALLQDPPRPSTSPSASSTLPPPPPPPSAAPPPFAPSFAAQASMVAHAEILKRRRLAVFAQNAPTHGHTGPGYHPSSLQWAPARPLSSFSPFAIPLSPNDNYRPAQGDIARANVLTLVTLTLVCVEIIYVPSTHRVSTVICWHLLHPATHCRLCPRGIPAGMVYVPVMGGCGPVAPKVCRCTHHYIYHHHHYNTITGNTP